MRRQQDLIVGWFGIVVLLFLIAESPVKTSARWNPGNTTSDELMSSPPVQLHRLDDHVMLDNGIVKVTLSTPRGMITRIQYKGIDNLLEYRNKESGRGYWDIVWSDPKYPKNIFFELDGTGFRVIAEDQNKIEVSFTRSWNSLPNDYGPPLNIDKRFIMLRGCPGFYSYAILEHLEGWPAVNLIEGRLSFKLQQKLFYYMALSDDRQRIMPSAEDRKTGKVLAYPEAVLLTNPANPALKGQVDDKYQFSCDNKDNRVHGWTCSDPTVGFWVIVPSDEFRTGGPVKQELTSHVGPTSLAVFFSGHYAGGTMNIKLQDGEPWKKVFGPVFIYLNSDSANNNFSSLWADAKQQMLLETKSWPYNFPLSEDFPHAHERATVSGRLLVRDRYMNIGLVNASFAYVGLAAPGNPGSWQTENKGYQFWNQTDAEGYFSISGVRPGTYSLYAWVPGFIGDYKYNMDVDITPGSEIGLGDLIYEPLRNGPTLWEIGIPDRTAAEFYVPNPDPSRTTHLYLNNSEKFRQYGLWERYTDLYPSEDLVYEVGVSNYQTDWFFAHVPRNIGNNTRGPTTWRILFDLPYVVPTGTYTIRLALASANGARVQIWINDPSTARPHFRTSLVGKDNSIARHGIHGLYWLYSFDVPSYRLHAGRNIIFLTQPLCHSPFIGAMYDYIRLEGPPYTY